MQAKLILALVLVLAMAALGIGGYAYGVHVGKQAGQIETDKTVLDYSNRALESEEHARTVEEQTNAQLQADHDSYTEQIALLKRAHGASDSALRAGTQQLRLKLDSALTLAANQGSAVTGGPVGDSTVQVPPAIAANLAGYCVDDFNAMRLQLASVIKSYGDASAACSASGP